MGDASGIERPTPAARSPRRARLGAAERGADGTDLDGATPDDVRRRDAHPADEIWIGVLHVLDSDDWALAWVRRADEWLADAALAPRGDEIARLAAMYEAAVAKRGHAPSRLNVRAAAHADALRARLDGVVIDVGFDTRAQELSDAAASAIDVIFGAEAQVREAEAEAEAEAASEADAGRAGAPHLVATAYDPARTPQPAAWLAMPKPERQRHVRMAHLALTDAPRGHALQLHAGMHEAVETQLAEDEPPDVAHALARLERVGASRHDAIHAIARVLMRRMQAVLTTEQPFDTDAYLAELRDLGDREA